ncbi:hypothetical protein GCM10027167_17700 [Nocardia heshunensis]
MVAASGWLALAAVAYLPADTPLRIAAVFGFVLLGPGFAISGLLSSGDRLERWVLTVALSLSLGLLVTVGFTELRDSSVDQRLAVLAAVTTMATLVDIVWAREREPEAGGTP